MVYNKSQVLTPTTSCSCLVSVGILIIVGCTSRGGVRVIATLADHLNHTCNVLLTGQPARSTADDEAPDNDPRATPAQHSETTPTRRTRRRSERSERHPPSTTPRPSKRGKKRRRLAKCGRDGWGDEPPGVVTKCQGGKMKSQGAGACAAHARPLLPRPKPGLAGSTGRHRRRWPIPPSIWARLTAALFETDVEGDFVPSADNCLCYRKNSRL